MMSNWSMDTGHSCTQARQLVHAQSSVFGDVVVEQMPLAGGRCRRAAVASQHGSPPTVSMRRCRVLITILRGLSGLPVMFAGQTDVHRPHSVHE